MYFALFDCVIYEKKRHIIDWMDDQRTIAVIIDLETNERKKVDMKFLEEMPFFSDGVESVDEEGDDWGEYKEDEEDRDVEGDREVEGDRGTEGRRPTEEEKKNFIRNQKNKKTIAKTKYSAAQLNAYLKEVGERRSVPEIPPRELNNYIEDYIMVAKKKDGQEYEPGSLRGIFAGIARYLTDIKYEESLMGSAIFKGAREMLASKFKVNIKVFLY
jgi:hypothetical protein